MPKPYKQLTQTERDRMSLFKAQGKSLRAIAGLIGRNVSTVSRELKRNSRPFHCDYLPHWAQERAAARKAAAHERQRLREPGLQNFVRGKLRAGWSPERIAGRWKMLGFGAVSYEAIYQWIYADSRDFVPFLLRAHRRRKRRCRSSKRRTWKIPSRTPISERPKDVELRTVPGHWECDTIMGSNNGSALRLLVERKTRYSHLSKLKVKTAASLRKSVNHALGRYPQNLLRTITYDNGSENTQHQQINENLGTDSYFCEPMHSWEKGTVENTAGLVRRRLPKGTNFDMVSGNQIRGINRWVNDLPRKCLGYKTPAEALRESVALAG